MKVWTNELNELLERIERHTSASLWRIKRDFERSGMKFDRKFRKRFLRLTNHRLSETFDRVEIESLAKDQRSRVQKRYRNDINLDWRRNAREWSGECEQFWQESENQNEFNSHHLSKYKNQPVFYSPNARNPQRERSAIHKRLGKKVVPKDDDDELPIDISMIQNNQSNATNPFRMNRISSTMSNAFGAKSTQSLRVTETITSQSAIQQEPVSMEPVLIEPLRIKVEVPSLPASPRIESTLKRKRDIPSEYEVNHDIGGSDLDSDSGIEKVDAKRQKIVDDVPSCEFEEDALSLTEMTFFCMHCMDANECNESNSGTLEDVYGHWLSGHTDLNDVKPFLFYVTRFVTCFHCNEVSNYHKMIEHHQKAHPEKKFVVVSQNRQECALCQFTGDDMTAHFDDEHKGPIQPYLTNPKFFNSARWPERLLNRILAIDIHKKRQCGHCGEIFETQYEADAHHLGVHTEEVVCNEYFDTKSPYVICDHCSSKVEGAEFFSHIKNHAFDFTCSKCDYKTVKLMELIIHEKDDHHTISLNYHCNEFSHRLKNLFYNSKVIFGNGLILTHQNFNGTNYDVSKKFDAFIERLIENVKKPFNAMFEAEQTKKSDSSIASSAPSFLSDVLNEEATIQHYAHSIVPHYNPIRMPSLSAKKIELEKQNQLNNNLTIVALPRRKNDDELEMFLKLCHQLNATVSKNDIAYIYRSGGINERVVVKFRNHNTKVMVKNCAHKKQVWTNDLVKLAPDEEPVKIFVNLHTTRYFGKMLKIANEARKIKTLYSQYLCKRGLIVKRTENSAGQIVLSTRELIDYIYGDKSTRHSTGDEWHPSDRSS